MEDEDALPVVVSLAEQTAAPGWAGVSGLLALVEKAEVEVVVAADDSPAYEPWAR